LKSIDLCLLASDQGTAGFNFLNESRKLSFGEVSAEG
jgi:hypothetical protein